MHSLSILFERYTDILHNNARSCKDLIVNDPDQLIIDATTIKVKSQQRVTIGLTDHGLIRDFEQKINHGVPNATDQLITC